MAFDDDTPPSRNPDWTRDELILALDLYMRRDRKAPDQRDPGIITLSQELRALAHRLRGNDEFRTPSGVPTNGGCVAAARRRGDQLDRPPTLTPGKLDLAVQLVAGGKAVAVRMVSVDPATLRRALKR